MCMSLVWRPFPVRGPASDPSVTRMLTPSSTERREGGGLFVHIHAIRAFSILHARKIKTQSVELKQSFINLFSNYFDYQ